MKSISKRDNSTIGLTIIDIKNWIKEIELEIEPIKQGFIREGKTLANLPKTSDSLTSLVQYYCDILNKKGDEIRLLKGVLTLIVKNAAKQKGVPKKVKLGRPRKKGVRS